MTKQIKIKPSPFFQLGKLDILQGITIGALFSFLFYSFMYMTRECFRLFSVTEDFDLWILSDPEVNFYNLIFAFIAVVTAQSFVFTYWLDRPKKLFSKKNHQRISVLTDQRFMTWGFLSWFSKVAFIFGFLYGDVFERGFYVISFYPDFNLLFISFIVIFFLHAWISLRKILGKPGIKWMLTSAVIIAIYACCLSKINLIDYKAINDTILSSNVAHTHALELPASNVYEKGGLRSLQERIFLVDTGQVSGPSVFIYQDKISMDSLHLQVLRIWADYPIHIQRRIGLQLFIHKKIKMKDVNRLKEELSKTGYTNVYYAVVPTGHKFGQGYYRNHFLKMLIPDKVPGIPSLPTPEPTRPENTFVINIQIDEKNVFYINEVKTHPLDMKAALKKLFQNNEHYFIELSVHSLAEYGAYIRAISSVKDATLDLWDNLSMELSGKHFTEHLNYELKKKIKNRFPPFLMDYY
ncbi:MAG: hypothetical protein AAFZ15_05395 [Bacteroidota bacterium]